jgi:hypothetical protein
MSSYGTRRTEKTVVPPSRGDIDALNPTVAISSYVEDMVKALRQLTRASDQRDLSFLDYLLALAEQEASMLSVRAYH